eukprot:6175503-Pleurochrysis_carterae.AAC.1
MFYYRKSQATELTDFYADHSGLHGEIPEELACLTNLEDFVVSRNRLSGEVPQSVVSGASQPVFC